MGRPGQRWPPDPVEWWRTRSKWSHALYASDIGRRSVQFYCGKLTAGRMKNLGKKRPTDACAQCLYVSGRNQTKGIEDA